MISPVVLVTGAGGGMGRAIAQRFARDGWRIAATDFDDAKLDALESMVPLVARVPADLRSAEACHGVLAETMARAGRIDALVNAAGVWREGPVESFTEADFDLVLAVNLKATFFMCSACIPALRATQGAIVNISSDAGRQGNVGAATYCASKGGATNFTRAPALLMSDSSCSCRGLSSTTTVNSDTFFFLAMAMFFKFSFTGAVISMQSFASVPVAILFI